MGLKDLFKKNLAKTERFKEIQEEFRMRKMLEDRMKSANERELERFHEEEREKSIKRNLEEFRKHRQEEAMKTTVLGGKNMFTNNKNIFSDKPTMLRNNKKLLNGGCMFFK